MNVGCRIIVNARRTKLDPYLEFRDIPVANVDDCMNRLAALDAAIRPLNKQPLFGSALTVKVPAGDNLMFHKAMDMIQPGDVVVIDAGGDTNRAILGELMLLYSIEKGATGIIVDGSVRDTDIIENLPIPVYARGITPNGPWKNGPGEINTIISCGGQVIRPGDLLLGDCDGVIVIHPEEADELLQKALNVMKSEAAIIDNIKRNKSFIRPWVDQKLEELQCEYIELNEESGREVFK